MTPVSTKEAAAYLGFHESTLRRWRSSRDRTKGPRFAVLHGRVWYSREWLDEWRESVWSKVRS